MLENDCAEGLLASVGIRRYVERLKSTYKVLHVLSHAVVCPEL